VYPWTGDSIVCCGCSHSVGVGVGGRLGVGVFCYASFEDSIVKYCIRQIKINNDGLLEYSIRTNDGEVTNILSNRMSALLLNF